MKNNTYLYIITFFLFIFFSCESSLKHQRYKIEVFLFENIDNSKNAKFNGDITKLFYPIEINNIGYVPVVTFTRLDVDSTSENLIRLDFEDESSIAKIQKSVGSYGYNSYKNYLTEEIPKLKIGEVLAQKSNKIALLSLSEIEESGMILSNDKNLSGSNIFKNSEEIKKEIIKRLENGETEFQLYYKPKFDNGGNHTPIFDPFIITVTTELINISNTALSIEERQELADNFFNEYFDNRAFVSVRKSNNDSNPTIFDPGEADMYLSSLVMRESLLDFNITNIEISRETNKISGLYLIEVNKGTVVNEQH